MNIQQRNLVMALRLGIIDWFKYFELTLLLPCFALAILSGCATQSLQLNAPAGVDQAQAILDREACTKRHMTSNGNMYFDEDFYNACMMKKGYVFKLVSE